MGYKIAIIPKSFFGQRDFCGGKLLVRFFAEFLTGGPSSREMWNARVRHRADLFQPGFVNDFLHEQISMFPSPTLDVGGRVK
jgi:hypothetical protein